VREAAEADLAMEKIENMSIGKMKKKENPIKLKPIAASSDNLKELKKSEGPKSEKISTTDKIKAQQAKERQAKAKQKADAMLAIKNDMKSLLEGAQNLGVSDSQAVVLSKKETDSDMTSGILKDI